MNEARIAELTSGELATQVLERWAGGPVRATLVSGCPEPERETLERLGVDRASMIACRHVRLMRGDSVLSDAYNWFVPDRLTPAMRDALECSDTPFGTVIAPLAPRRQTLACVELPGDPMLEIRALVMSGDDVPLAEVAERYHRVLVG